MSDWFGIDPSIKKDSESKIRIDEKARKAVRRAAKIVVLMIPWDDSRKGVHFWEEVYYELERISKTGEP